MRPFLWKNRALPCHSWGLIVGLLSAMIAQTALCEQGVLTLESVLSSTRRAFPSILEAEEKRRASESAIQAAQGSFDAKLKTDVYGYQEGYYDGRVIDTKVEKPLPVFGIQLDGSYRRSNGTFPVYEGNIDTASGGELGLGILLPLMRDRLIDEPRAKVASSQLDMKSADASLKKARIEVLRDARAAYWTWIAAGLQRKVIADLVSVAELRQKQLDVAVQAGDKPQFDLLDNSRTIFKRQTELAKAEQIIAKAAIQLSLYYRDGEGNPSIPPAHHASDSLAHTIDVTTLNEEELIKEGIQNRPELQSLEAKLQKAGIQIDLGNNLLQPRLNLKVGGYAPVGSGDKSLTENEVKVGINVEVPLELNKPRGMVAEGLAKQRAVDAKTRLTRDKIEAEIRKHIRALQLTEGRIAAARESRIAADQVADGERARFQHGDSNLVFVVIREQTAAEAALDELSALLDFHLIHAELLAALGQV
jgi:outer membrane protein TolC